MNSPDHVPAPRAKDLAIILLAVVLYAVHGTHNLIEGRPEDLLWACHVGVLIIGAGFEPGGSTDLRAVQIAARFNADQVINMSNIDYVYSEDPKKNPAARKLERISWTDFRKLVGDEWDPGLNMPFDPIASQAAESLGLTVVIIGNDIGNLEKQLNAEPFSGTTIL